MRSSARAISLVLAFGLLLAACSSGETEVSGVSEGGATEATAPTGATATGATGATAATGTAGAFDGPVSLDLRRLDTGGFPIERAFFSCDGVLSTWTYIFKADFGSGIAFDIESTVDLSSGSGTLVFGDTLEIPDLGSVTWEDTVDLEVAGTPDAPTIRSTNATVEISGAIPLPENAFEFPENKEFPVLSGSDRC